MQSVRLALLSLSLTGTAIAQFIPGVVTTSGMGTFSTYNILNLTNGVGLSSTSLDATHSVNWQDMWITNNIQTGWVQFDLGSVQPLAAIAVWNYNSSISTGRGVASMDVSTSTDAVNWTPFSRESVPRASAVPNLPHLIQVGGVPARYVKFDVLANHGDTYTGLSEVQFVAGTGVLALNRTLGEGCVRVPGSFYEFFSAATAFDLSNSSFTMVRNAAGYIVVGGTSAFIPPSPGASVLTLANNAQVAVPLAAPFPHSGGSTLTLSVCSNGYVAIASGNTTSGTPAVATMLAAAQTAWWVWHDYNPQAVGSGQVKFEMVGPLACVTFDGVFDNGGTTPANVSTFQFQFDTSSGNVHVVFQTMSALGNGYLVGYSPGGASFDPGNTDLSVALPASITVRNNDVLPLTLTGVTRPVIGGSWTMTVSNVPATGTIGIDVLGLSDPSIPDLAGMGAPGCGQRASLDALTVWLVAGSSHPVSITVPNNPVLVHLHVFTMSIVLQPGVNALFGGTITSNGIDGRVGNL